MRDHSLLLFAVIIFGYIAGYCVAQPQTEESHQQPIGAYRVYQKTHFQCAGRPSGYYADVETGCQVYHMCDGLGRQFSYSCPNTTLFQQRMLICDHWYMVNCSRAESNYDANLLIGQRDKPFVTDQENELRTPRPDLLDRPYAADYAGESFRNQYTLTQASPNSLDADVDSTPIKPFVRPNQPYTFATHWSTQHPSKVQSTVNPPPLTPFVLSNDLLPPLQQTLAPNNHQTDAVDGSAAQFAHNHDLALSSSQDSRRSEPESNFINAIPTVKTEVKKPLVHFTPPHAQPQYNINYAQVTQQQLPSTATATAFTQTLTESTTAESSQPTTDDVTDRTPQPFVARKPSASGNHRGHTKFNQPNSGNKANAPAAKFSLGETGRILSRPSNELVTDHRPSSAAAHEPVRIPSPPPSDLLPPFDKVQIYDDATTQGPPIYSQWKIPSSGLLPPLLHAKLSRANSPPDNQLNVGGGAATVKPPKSVPANSVPISALKRPAIGLQPPRFEAPATEAPSVQLFQNSQHNLFRKSNLVQTTPSFPLPTTEPTTTTSINLIPAETPSFAQHNHHHKSPTPRSVPPTSNAAAATASSGADVATNHLHTRDNHYLELKKLLHIPDYTFPLEADTQSRGHYVRGDSVNSFQVRIPVGVNDVTDDDGGAATAPTTASPTGTTQGAAVATTTTGGGDDGGTTGTTVRTRRAPWYGENAACPECHPSFVKAGSCEPCVKIRR